MEPETYVGILTIDFERQEVCVGWGKDFEELRKGEDRCFSIAEPEKNFERGLGMLMSETAIGWELDLLLSKAVIQSVRLENKTIKIYLIGIF
jgi:hypothetical protein